MTHSIESVMNLMTEGATVSQAIIRIYKTQRIRFAYNEAIFDRKICYLDLDGKTINSCLRNKIHTLNDFIRATTHKEHIRGIGEYSAKKIFCKIIDIAWNNMKPEERAEFLLYVDVANEAIEQENN